MLFEDYIKTEEGAYIVNKFGVDVARNNWEAEGYNKSVDNVAIAEGYNSLAHKHLVESRCDARDKKLDIEIARIKRELAKEVVLTRDVISVSSNDIDFNSTIERINDELMRV